MKREPRLQFSDADLAEPKLEKPIKRVKKAEAKADKAQAKIPKKTVVKKERGFDPATGKVKTQLRFEEVDKKKPPSKLTHPDNAEEMVFEAEDIIKHDGMFGITQPDWDAVKGHIPPRDVEQRFLNSPTDSMAIYQLRRDAPVELRFASLGSLAAPPDPANYEAIYTREVYPDDDTGRILENFYYIFNDERPGDFVGHSLSVSDIVALKQDGKVSYHYCDSMGFQELPAFQKPENYLKAAEMSMEDDYGMIDGIINNGPKQPTVADLEAQVKAGMSISLMDLAAAPHRERDAGERKPSVLEQLKNHPVQERPHKTAPKKSAEKEL